MTNFLSYMSPLIPKDFLEGVAILFAASTYPVFLYYKSVDPTNAAKFRTQDSTIWAYAGIGTILLLALIFKNRAWTYYSVITIISTFLVATIG